MINCDIDGKSGECDVVRTLTHLNNSTLWYLGSLPPHPKIGNNIVTIPTYIKRKGTLVPYSLDELNSSVFNSFSDFFRK